MFPSLVRSRTPRRRPLPVPRLAGLFTRAAVRLGLGGAALVVALLSGCVLAPEGLKQETERATGAGEGWRAPIEERELPELPPQPSWDDFVRRALAANGEVEAAWASWAAAIERVSVEAGWPNTNLALDF